MTLLVIGESPAALATAGLAAMASGEPVLIGATADGPHPALTHVELAGRTLPAVLAWATSDVAADLYVLVADVVAHEHLLRTWAGPLAGRSLLVVAGGVGGARATAALLARLDTPMPRIAETVGFPAIGRLDGSTVLVRAIKQRLPAWGDPGTGFATPDLARFQRYFPDLLADDLLTTSLSNTNHVIHPAVTLANADRIRGGIGFRFYREGLTAEAIANVEAVDRERVALAVRLGAPARPLTWWMASFYGDQGLRGASVEAQLRGFDPLSDSNGPTSFLDRYLLDDVGVGLAPLESLAARSGIGTPTMSALIDQASALTGRDLRAGAAARADLVLEELSRGSPVTTGSVPMPT